MSPRSSSAIANRVRPFAAGTAMLLLLSACDRSSRVEQPVGEIRGAPIQSASAKIPTATAPTNAAAVTTSSNPPAAASALRATPLTPAAPQPGAPPVVPPAGNPSSISFEQLAGFTFEISDDLLGPVTNDLAAVEMKTNAQIPETVKAFNQKKVALRGFMLPLKVEGGLVTEMLIMKDQSMCCYGTTPRINDWVSVKMRNKGVRPMMDLPVTLHGTLRVGEMRENGYLVGIYSMDGEGMDAPENP